MCKCVNVEMGSYDNAITLPTPPHMREYTTRPPIMVDDCLAEEIQELWSHNITTTWSCCGHNKVLPAIGVIDEDIPKMLELGYKKTFNNNVFLPKSV